MQSTTQSPPHDLRTLEQNALMWSLLDQISAQVVWYGEKLSAEEWKDVCTAALRGHRVVPGIERGTVVVLGLRTSKMNKQRMGELIDLIVAFGTEHGVAFREYATEER
jgi:hypothetical protein